MEWGGGVATARVQKGHSAGFWRKRGCQRGELGREGRQDTAGLVQRERGKAGVCSRPCLREAGQMLAGSL